ncbi:MAG TPA: phosphoketolase family protein, partial [Capsulimonadaceae bacterium]|nr:phosphoketolase family protein [Capsulimonadaceae bacterium]
MAAPAALDHTSHADTDPGRHIEVPGEDLSEGELHALQTYWRAVNYLGGAQVYLKDNFLLQEPLKPQHIKDRLLGHWGTVPGLNLIYLHLNRLIRQQDANVLLVIGPGHGAPAALANTYLEGSLEARYSDLSLDRAGLERLIKSFSWPGGFPSHLNPGTPGAIHEGGELGYALSTAFGAAMDNPNLLVACIVGDGECETGPTATAWHCPKYMNPAHDGFVLPFVHVNRYKISSETIYGSMTDAELVDLFEGYGYDVMIVHGEGDTEEDYFRVHRRMASAVDRAWVSFQKLRAGGRESTLLPRQPWPIIVLRSPKGWTGIKEADGHPIEGSYRSHQVPLEDVRKNPEHLAKVEHWLRSYRPHELWDSQGRPNPVVLAQCPAGERRIGMNPHSNGGVLRQDLLRPDFRDYACPVKEPGQIKQGDMGGLAPFLRDVIKRNEKEANFRIFSPDELTSNRLTEVFEATDRKFEWPWDPSDDYMGKSGRVVEILSEHTCQGWLQGYLLTGRHGLFPCYEAFVSIVDSMMNQYAKFLKQSDDTPWRAPVSSFNYILSSEGWRQDHNGYSHQGPGFINNLLNKKARNVRIYLPPDTNCLLSTIDHCLTSLDKIN